MRTHTVLRQLRLVLLLALPLLTVLSTTWHPHPAAALSGSSFQAGRIIDDTVFFNRNSMNVQEIQNFLNAKVPTCDTNGNQMYNSTMTRAQYGASKGYSAPYICLKDYSQSTPTVAAESGLCSQYNGGTKSSAQIIYDVSQACGISPKVLIVLLQKEQTLVTDDWPWPTQYQKATGYGCPDTAPCDSQYYGFFNQIYNAARIYRKYQRDASTYSYQAGRNNNILYNPNTACGSSSVFIQSQATAGLYIYTPYQPNQAALDNLYGTGDSCSAYGNRNFWRLFNDWFGTTLYDFQVIQPSGGGAIYIEFEGMKQLIKDMPTLQAWGFDKYVIQTVSDSYINSLTTYSDPLTRYVNDGTGDYYIDNQSAYRVSGPVFGQWKGFNWTPISSVYPKLMGMTIPRGDLTELVKQNGGSTIYLMDGGQLRPFSTYDTFTEWQKYQNNVIEVSSQVMSEYPIGSAISSNVVTSGANDYLISNDLAYKLESGQLDEMPSTWTVATVDSSTINSRISGQLGHVIGTPSDPAIYILDGGTKRPFNTFDLYKSYSQSKPPTIINSKLLASIPTGQPVDHSLFGYSGTNGLLDHTGKLYCFDSNTASDFAAGSKVMNFQSNSTLQWLLSRGCASATPYVKASGTPAIYALSAGSLYPVPDLTTLFAYTDKPVLELLANDIGTYTQSSQSLKTYVTDGTNDYLIDGHSHYRAAGDVLAQWQLSNPINVGGDLLNTLGNGGDLTTHINVNGTDYLVDKGRGLRSPDASIAITWQLKNASISLTPLCLQNLILGRTLSRLVKAADSNSQYSGALFVPDNGKLYTLQNMDQLANISAVGDATPLSDTLMTALSAGAATLHTFLVNDGSTTYVLDANHKRPIPTSDLTYWTGGNTTTQLSSAFLSIFPNTSPITSSISNANSPAIRYMDGGKAYTYQTFDQYLNGGRTPATRVGDKLWILLPNASN